jgi:hypothetical protein
MGFAALSTLSLRSTPYLHLSTIPRSGRSTTLALIKKELTVLDPTSQPDDGDGGYQTAVILLAAEFVTGTDVQQLTKFTGYSKDFVAAVCSRMQKSGLWEESGTIHSDHWYQGDAYRVPCFWADVLVGMGLLIAEWREDSGFLYRASHYKHPVV